MFQSDVIFSVATGDITSFVQSHTNLILGQKTGMYQESVSSAAPLVS